MITFQRANFNGFADWSWVRFLGASKTRKWFHLKANRKVEAFME